MYELLRRLQAGDLNLDAAHEAVNSWAASDLGFARLDHRREARCGFPEVIFGSGKTAAQIERIMTDFVDRGRNAFVTRLAPAAADSLVAAFPDASYNERARTLTLLVSPPPPRPGTVVIVTAGTSDQPAALEADETLRFLGYAPQLVQDVGVAGLHRLLAQQDKLRAAQVIIVVAGMEGALPSVVGGLVSVPVIGVPTSVGYGVHLGGLTPLFAMINSCASGITVVNIDNGFGAACAAARMLAMLAVPSDPPPTPKQAADTRSA